jgi:phenol/toluene 2-monooxygenase (NADH) P3/A3
MTQTTQRKKKLPLKERYALLTRDLDWEPSYVERTVWGAKSLPGL